MEPNEEPKEKETKKCPLNQRRDFKTINNIGVMVNGDFQDCIKEKCAWFRANENPLDDDPGDCAVAFLQILPEMAVLMSLEK